MTLVFTVPSIYLKVIKDRYENLSIFTDFSKDHFSCSASVMASGAVEACQLVVLVAASHVLVVVGDEFRAGDPFLCAIPVATFYPLDLPRVLAAREKVDATLVLHTIVVRLFLHLNSNSPGSADSALLNPWGSACGSAWWCPH